MLSPQQKVRVAKLKYRNRSGLISEHDVIPLGIRFNTVKGSAKRQWFLEVHNITTDIKDQIPMSKIKEFNGGEDDD